MALRGQRRVVVGRRGRCCKGRGGRCRRRRLCYEQRSGRIDVRERWPYCLEGRRSGFEKVVRVHLVGWDFLERWNIGVVLGLAVVVVVQVFGIKTVEVEGRMIAVLRLSLSVVLSASRDGMVAVIL